MAIVRETAFSLNVFRVATSLILGTIRVFKAPVACTSGSLNALRITACLVNGAIMMRRTELANTAASRHAYLSTTRFLIKPATIGSYSRCNFYHKSRRPLGSFVTHSFPPHGRLRGGYHNISICLSD